MLATMSYDSINMVLFSTLVNSAAREREMCICVLSCIHVLYYVCVYIYIYVYTYVVAQVSLLALGNTCVSVGLRKKPSLNYSIVVMLLFSCFEGTHIVAYSAGATKLRECTGWGKGRGPVCLCLHRCTYVRTYVRAYVRTYVRTYARTR